MQALVQRITDVPVLCCELFGDREAALRCPRGSIELVRGARTGLVSNRRFDPQTQQFSANYEETQSFSDHFNAYARAIAEQMAERHHLQGKTVVEIGCGKGAFLIGLCAIAGARGIGIDPAFVAGRHAVPHGTDLRFLAETLSTDHAGLNPDLVLCRHTLEHIGDLPKFLRLVRMVMTDRPGVVLSIDVPDSTRIFREGAFWDDYYEHCHYFTPGSLAGTLRDAGFELTRLYREYDNQFLCAEARIETNGGDRREEPGEVFEIEETLSEASDDIARFAENCTRQIAGWEQWFADHHGERIVLWGAGSKAVGFLTALSNADVVCAVDVNPHKAGKFLPGSGTPVIGPGDLKAFDPDHVIIMNPVYVDEISAEARRNGISPTLWTLGPLPIKPLTPSA